MEDRKFLLEQHEQREQVRREGWRGVGGGGEKEAGRETDVYSRSQMVNGMY